MSSMDRRAGHNNGFFLLTVLSFVVMALFGFLENIRGTVIPAIKKEFGVDYSSIGLMLFVTGAGYLVAPFIGGVAIDRYGRRHVLALGLIFLMVGIVGLQFVGSYSVLIALLTLLTSGFGLLEVGLNALGGQIFITNAAVMMSFLHLFYGVGASVSPRYAGLLLFHDVSWRNIYLYSLALVGIIFIFLLLARFPGKSSVSEQRFPVKSLLCDRRVWLFVAVLGFCQLAENGIGNWLVTFLQVERGMDERSSSQYLSLFFVAFTLGRVVGGYIAERIGYVDTVLYCTVFSTLLFAGGLAGGGPGLLLFPLMGFFISIKYPTVMTIIMKEFSQGNAMGSAMGFIITGAATVSMAFNWLIGKVNDCCGVQVGFGSLLVYTAMIIFFLAPLSRMLTYRAPEEDLSPETPASAPGHGLGGS